MRAIIAGPCVSEFGWECMEFQGHLRKCAQGISGDNIIISTSPHMEALYADMDPIFMRHEIEGDRDCHRLRDSTRAAKAIIQTERILNQAEADFKAQGITVYRLKSWTQSWKRHKIEDQLFVPYGKQMPNSPDIVIHARNRTATAKFTGDNYPVEMWDTLLDMIKRRLGTGYIAAVGSFDAAMSPVGAQDYRGAALSQVMDLMASAKVVIGPSSGPMHLASLCKTPHVVWCTNKKQPAVSCTNDKRYKTEWNPFRTPVEVILHEKGGMLPPGYILEAAARMWKYRGT